MGIASPMKAAKPKGTKTDHAEKKFKVLRFQFHFTNELTGCPLVHNISEFVVLLRLNERLLPRSQHKFCLELPT